MKRNIFKIAAILLISLGNIFTRCDDPEKYPIEISVQDYMLGWCSWINWADDSKIIIINSDEEMNKYVSCHELLDYPTIDFSKHSLLLVDGTASAGIYDVKKEKKMQQISPNEYVLNIGINLNSLTEPTKWYATIITNKLRQNAKIELKIEELPTSIIGKWKLMKMRLIDNPEKKASEIDCSQDNVIYEFKTNGILTISGDCNEKYTSLKKGDQNYSIGNYGRLFIDAADELQYSLSSQELRIFVWGVFYVDSYLIKLD